MSDEGEAAESAADLVAAARRAIAEDLSEDEMKYTPLEWVGMLAVKLGQLAYHVHPSNSAADLNKAVSVLVGLAVGAEEAIDSLLKQIAEEILREQARQRTEGSNGAADHH